MATPLPWGRGGGPSAGLSLPGECEIAILPCDNTMRRMFSFRSSRFSVLDGHHIGTPGVPYEIEVKFRARATAASGIFIVQATIDGTQINEQLVLRAPGGTARLCDERAPEPVFTSAFH